MKLLRVSSCYLAILRMEREDVENAVVEKLMSRVQRMRMRNQRVESFDNRGSNKKIRKVKDLAGF